jgi:nitrogen fixation NifU-like protein
MSDLRELYQHVILDHSRKPRNFHEPAGANRHAEGHNPLCGDQITVHVKLAGDVIEDAGFEGSGCAISRASASLMTDAVKGKTAAEARALSERFQRMVRGEGGEPAAVSAVELGRLAALAGVREFPVRVKCATLAWHTLVAALAGKDARISTE